MATPGKHTDFQISVQEMVNDLDVREVSPKHRGCRFPDEIIPNSSFRVYSFSTCIVDCIGALQMRYCNCTIFNLMPTARADMPDCDYKGILCLEKEMKISPDIKLLLPWPENNETCDCLPSCTEHDLRSVSEYSPRCVVCVWVLIRGIYSLCNILKFTYSYIAAIAKMLGSVALPSV